MVRPEVGMGVTGTLWTDREALTIIRVSPSGKTFWAQKDRATLSPDWKPEIIPGGFAGHCVNNSSQKWTYEPNPSGPVHRFTLCKDGHWSSPRYRKCVRIGVRSAFHDYNF